MKEQIVEIVNDLGLHARPASKLSHLAGTFTASVTLVYGGTEVNAKSVLGLLTLAAPKGAQLTVRTDGEDEGEALAAIADLVARGFDE